MISLIALDAVLPTLERSRHERAAEQRGAGRGQRQSLVAGEFVLTGEDLRQIAAIIHADAGIHLTEAKAALVYSRLSKRLRALGLESFRDYCALVASREGLDERQKMLAALTTNVTRFFREQHHFDHLAKQVLPPLLDAARRGGRVRIWSAACSNGAGALFDRADHPVADARRRQLRHQGPGHRHRPQHDRLRPRRRLLRHRPAPGAAGAAAALVHAAALGRRPAASAPATSCARSSPSASST